MWVTIEEPVEVESNSAKSSFKSLADMLLSRASALWLCNAELDDPLPCCSSLHPLHPLYPVCLSVGLFAHQDPMMMERIRVRRRSSFFIFRWKSTLRQEKDHDPVLMFSKCCLRHGLGVGAHPLIVVYWDTLRLPGSGWVEAIWMV